MASDETVADIVREMRDEWATHYFAEDSMRSDGAFPEDHEDVDTRDLADRIEAAVKRELATSEESSAVGDAAKRRVALTRIITAARVWRAAKVDAETAVQHCHDIAADALSAPPRNCDVGTTQEQAERYSAFCSRFPKCTGCPCCGKIRYNYCQFTWAQMPYEAEEGGAK